VVGGDRSLSEKAEADYPRDIEVGCERYELPAWSMHVMRVLGWVESGLMTIHDLGAWDLDAIEIASAERARIHRERMEAD